MLDILSNGNNINKVQPHLGKLFDSLDRLHFTEIERKGSLSEFSIQKSKSFTSKNFSDNKNNNASETETDNSHIDAFGMVAKDGEIVKFASQLFITGKVENWLNDLLEKQRETVQYFLREAVQMYEEKQRESLILEYPAQVSLTACQIWWAREVTMAFARLEEGYENSIREYSRKLVTQLNTLITLLLDELTPQERQKIMTVCTIDVHNRDIVLKLVNNKVFL